jgi:uncharacterized glyoxalase superfamily protein PhnB
MSDPGEDWPRISSALFYVDAGTAIDWLCKAFGFEVRLRIEGDGGVIEHSELTFGEGVIMVATAGAKPAPWRPPCVSPRQVGGANTQSLCVQVEDVDAHCARARAAGAKIATEPADQDYGEEYGAHRTYAAVDPEGHHWWFMKVVRGPVRR